VKAFIRLTAKAVALDRADVDTDQIMPKQFLKRIERTGFGQFVFHDWRQDPNFELNRPEAAGAKILLTGRNFGCGSSREHAPWGLQDYGFDVIIAPSFGDIFRQNSIQIGLVPVVLPQEEVKRLMTFSGQELTVDLEAQTVTTPDGSTVAFDFDPSARHRLLNGLDDIGLTLAHEDAIAAYEAAHA
jgi:3-isopropylmalate/(R)-2-methylmalate dehydratase small subunit